ncbi:MAG: hypothetical protein FWC41_13080 [Firmicutes bacterium]|nr:hypothetical protein [Bacillota bacterium]
MEYEHDDNEVLNKMSQLISDEIDREILIDMLKSDKCSYEWLSDKGKQLVGDMEWK